VAREHSAEVSHIFVPFLSVASGIQLRLQLWRQVEVEIKNPAVTFKVKPKAFFSAPSFPSFDTLSSTMVISVVQKEMFCNSFL
jgi:hypothetical protein